MQNSRDPVSIKIEGEHLAAATTKFKNRDFHGTITECDKVLSLNVNSELAYQWKGTAKFKLGDYSGSIAEFNKAIKIKPEFAKAITNWRKQKVEK